MSYASTLKLVDALGLGYDDKVLTWKSALEETLSLQVKKEVDNGPGLLNNYCCCYRMTCKEEWKCSSYQQLQQIWFLSVNRSLN